MLPAIDETHDPARRSWVSSAGAHAEFAVQNLPLGVFTPGSGAARGGVAIGDMILDLAALSRSDLLHGPAQAAAQAAEGTTLNPLLALGAEPRRALRRALSALLCDAAAQPRLEPLLHPAAACSLHLPARIGDYTDFYAGIHHATNVGRLFRPDNPLLPNYRHVPIGYHGRASSVRASGATVRRPAGQRRAAEEALPVFAPTARLDYEVELGIWIGPGNALGAPIAITDAGQHVAGLCLLNDWSARDIQAWEYQPLGPFLAKSFLTTVSPWIVTAEALAPFRVAIDPRPPGDPSPLPYLAEPAERNSGYAVTLDALISTPAMRAQGLPAHRLSTASARHLYWSVAQLVTHHSSNGCNLEAGDLLGTGTLSAPEPQGFGSLLEISRGGQTPVRLPTGESRLFLQDGDQISLAGRAEAAGFVSIGFGPCSGLVVPAA